MNERLMGAHHGMIETDYFAVDAFSNSGGTQLLRSIAHFHNQQRYGFAATDAMLLGKAVHTLVLEPELWAQQYVIEEKVDKRTKAGKLAAAEFEANRNGRIGINTEFFDQARFMSDNVLAHPAASIVLAGAKTETSIFWEQHKTYCKARLDIPQLAYLGDLKTSKDASPDGFAKACANYGYFRQAAHYMDGTEAVTGNRPEGFVFVAVESSAPYSVGVYELSEADLELGRKQIERAATLYREYLHWRSNAAKNERPPGYSQTVKQISLPSWVHYQEEQYA